MVKRIIKTLAYLTLLLLIVAGFHFLSIYGNWFGEHEGPGQITQLSRSAQTVSNRHTQTQWQTPSPKHILFGDLHVHSTFSKDAFILDLPALGGGGAHPPADACDFARYCSGLDFWGISDHAEGLTPQHWRETKASIRQCNAVANDPANPDLVSFLGWEWSQVGDSAANHYGHKNIFFKDTGEQQVPTRPIGAATKGMPAHLITGLNTLLSIADFENRQRYYDHQAFLNEYSQIAPCDPNANSTTLPADCEESALTPEVLNRKLDEWGFDSLIIPHGNSWGMTSPIGADFATQLNRRDHNPDRQGLIEVFSGHGNSEEYRPWREVHYADSGERRCPAPSKGHLPGCYQAGQIILQRCLSAQIEHEECLQRQRDAEQHYIDAGLHKGFQTVPGATIDDWLDADQCSDCYLPAFNYIPRSSVQYAMALSHFDDQQQPLRYRFGFIGSSDNHAAMPGSGYKEFDRVLMSESRQPTQDWLRQLTAPQRGDYSDRSLPPEALSKALGVDQERYSSFTLTGGLVAVHSDSRRREDIWHALKNRQVYATSGPQILLWFDMINDNAEINMGQETQTQTTPQFRVRALGSFKQRPGCPEDVIASLGSQRIDSLCRGECFNPSNERHNISRIEVVRIRPQNYPAEPVTKLIEDVWQSFDCPTSQEGCEIHFEDPDFKAQQRDTLYYVRAIQEPTLAVNGEPFFCEATNEQGQCIRYRHCDISAAANQEGNINHCLGMNEERAWSSPIFVNFGQHDPLAL